MPARGLHPKILLLLLTKCHRHNNSILRFASRGQRVNYHSTEGTVQPPAEHTKPPACIPWQVTANGASPHNLPRWSFITLHMSREAAENILDSQKLSPPWPAGTWQKAVFLAEHTKRLPAFLLVPAQAESGQSGSPDWAEAGPWQGGRGRGLRDTYERQRIQPDFQPSAHRYLRTEGCSVFQRQFRKHTFLKEFSLLHPTHSTNQPCKNRVVRWKYKE